MGPGQITAATGRDHQGTGGGLNGPWQDTKIHGFSCRIARRTDRCDR
jgi:hypothetical protein